MEEWECTGEFSSLERLLFTLGFWVQVERVPEWVTAAHCRWYQSFRQEHDRSYFGVKEFDGDGLTYRIDHVPQGTKFQEEITYYVKVSWRDSNRNTSPAEFGVDDRMIEGLT